MKRIEGWKAIADELGCSTRTARRWADRDTDPLPVRVHAATGRIGATDAELRAWLDRQWQPVTANGHG